jgi:hypothetical protein
MVVGAMSQELLLTRYERELNLHDHRGCAECFVEDAIREFVTAAPCGDEGAASHRIHGREAIAQDLGMLMRAVPDVSVEVVSAGYGSDRRLWTEWRVRGTHSADWGRWRARGRRIEVLGVSVFRLSNAGFLEERLYWDSAFARGRREGLPGLRPGAGEAL